MTELAGVATRSGVVLSLAEITKRFRSVVALENVSFDLRGGTVHALLGENGAGKTTLMRIAFGMLRPDSGTVHAGGMSVRTTNDAIAAGIGMVHQHFTNVPAMTVAENVALGGHGAYDRRVAARRVIDIAQAAGLVLDPLARAEELPVGAQQRLEILKALARDATVLILDEPTAVLAPSESEELLRWVRAFAEKGNAAVIITHKLREALAVADDVTVLRRGRVALAGRARDRTERELATAMLGVDAAARGAETPRTHMTNALIARLSGVSVTDVQGVARLQDVSLELRAGELVGVAAVEGAGQRELLRVLSRRMRTSTGEAELPSHIGFVPEDRHRDALILEFDATENVALRDAGTRRGVIHWRRERQRAQRLIAAYDVRGGSDDQRVSALSGGNQQKLVIARELEDEPALLVAENPTRGLDIRAAAAVHDYLRGVARRGGAVVVYSSDLDEVLSLATRVVVVHAGRVIATPRDRELVGRALLGVT